MFAMLIQFLPYVLKPVFAVAHREFCQDLNQPHKAQDRVKRKLVQKLRQTAYGEGLGVHQVEDWHQIPIVDYAILEPWIQQQYQQPLKPILTPEKIHFWEFTSGSTGPKKSIPYTSSLRNSFSNMCCIWAYDLMQNGPAFTSYKSYLCISPTIATASQGVDDTDYLNPYLQWLIDRVLIRVQGTFSTVEAFRFALASALLETPDLEILSLWSPSFLTTQLAFMQEHHHVLRTMLQSRLNRTRLELLSEPVIPWEQLWSQLKLISCWDRQFAADQAKVLKHYFPNVWIQGKGLLATEAPMTIPLIPAKGCVPLLNQVVFEFLDSQNQVRNLTELEVGTTYELVISQLGGLYRYKIGDRVEVSHWYRETPCLTFVGRGAEVSDLVGEKLTVDFVTSCLDQLGYLQRGLCCLMPVQGLPPYYCLMLEQTSEALEIITQHLEGVLQQSFHYQRARQFGQLGAVQVIVSGQIAKWLQGDRRLGDCKYPVLGTQPVEAQKLNQLRCSNPQ